MPVTTRDLQYRADGLDMLGHLAIPDGDPVGRPGVVVFPEALGPSDHGRRWAERIADELGYVALAADLHGQARACSMSEMPALLQPLLTNPGRIHARTRETLDALTTQSEVDADRLAAIGFCIGGTFSLELALSGAPVRAAIGLHSRLELMTSPAAGAAGVRYAAVVGADDPIIPAEQRARFEGLMRTIGAPWQLHLLGGVRHSFTNPEADSRGAPEVQRYDAGATALAWRLAAELLDEALVDRRVG